jgi:hypothetical protein
MSDKPRYLGLLNAIALAETQAHCYLTAWIDETPHAGVRHVLATVAAREGEHGMAFAKRINELGYRVRPKEDPGAAGRLEIASSGRSDLEKFELLGLGRLDTGDKPDLFDNFFKDHTIDIATGALLGRYICEERDSGRLLRQCYEQLRAEAGVGAVSAGGAGGDRSDRGDRLAALEAKVDAVCQAIGDLTELVRPVSAVPAATTNGRSRAKAGKS